MKQRPKIKYVEKMPPDKPKSELLPKQDQSQKSEKYPNQPTEKYQSSNYQQDQKVESNQKPYLIPQEEKNSKYEPKEKYAKEEKARYLPKETPTESNTEANFKPQRKKQEVRAPQKFTERQSSQSEDPCLICSELIRSKDFIWTCSCCCISMHLRCIKMWIQNVNRDQPKQNKFILNWSCPQCKFSYSESMPKYYCYCGKFANPEYDRDLDPHSCGKLCNKKRGAFCPHLCPQVCHKGKCKPCDFEGTVVTCQCGKSQRVVKCSEQRQTYQCGKKCEKILNCHKHKCQRNCHYGDCFPCKKKHMATCFCQKNQDVIDCSQISYSCPDICAKKLQCGFHFCQEKCHLGDCAKCHKTPALQSTCPCGKYSIEMLTGDAQFRKSCADLIPVCGMPCNKKFQCGHACPRSCHEGPCSQCKVTVDQNCNCELTSRKIECWKKKKQIFKCDNICKRKRSCGQHACNTECCKFRNSPFQENHPCELTCPKILNCGKHQCGQACHIGLCKKCPVIYSQPQSCPCGKTSIKPPIICGTIAPECEGVCSKDLACGHKCNQICHYGSCTCYEDVEVSCRCGRQKIKTRCGRQALCLTKCQLVLECGHKCEIQCHKGTCQEAHELQPCRKSCNRQRLDCKHFCNQQCHDNKKCEVYPCEAEILIKCECGHRQTAILCGSLHSQKSSRKEILCNKKCQNLKRFDTFYKGKQIYYPSTMIQFAFKNFIYLQNLESKLQKFILHSEETFIEIEFKFPDNYTKILLHDLFENTYHLNTHFYRHKKFSSFTLMQTENTMIPKPVLSDYVKLITKGTIKRTNLPFQFTISFDVEHKDKADIILKSIKHFLHKYYVERKDKNFMIHFWNKNEGLDALNILENQFQIIMFRVSENIIKLEEDKIDQAEIIEIQEDEVNLIKVENSTNLEDKSKIIEKSQIKNNQQVSEQLKEEKTQIKQVKTQTEPQVTIKKIEEKPEKKLLLKNEAGFVAPLVSGPKIIMRRTIPNFKKNEYPNSTENVQDIYLIDQDQLYNEKVEWGKLAERLINTKMGPEAIQWRIRSLLIISSFSEEIKEEYFAEQFQKLIAMYNKDKQNAMRILEIQRLENKIVREEMLKNGIYLSHHEPEIMSYINFYNYLAEEKIHIEFPSIILESQQFMKSSEIIEAIEQNEWETFYLQFHNAEYVYACALVPLVHVLRENALQILAKREKIPANQLFKYLLFESEEEWIQFCQLNGLVIEKKEGKTKEQYYYCKEGKINQEKVKNNNFVHFELKQKRNKRHYLTEVEELVEENYMIRSFFAFGDHKESLSQKYMTNLIRQLKGQDK